MTDFASAAMLRLLDRGLHELGLQSPMPAAAAAAGPARGRGAHVAFDAKRALVAAALAQGGLACLPLLARGLRHFGDEPTLQALAGAATAHEMFERWMRLERYIHSRHRLVRSEASVVDGEVRLMHLGRRAGWVPLPAEDLVVLGVLSALLEQMGQRAVTATAGGAAAWPRPDGAALERAAQAGTTGQFHLCWQPAAVPQRSQAGRLVHADAHWPALVQQVFERLRDSVMSPPTLPQLAMQLQRSARSLQRHLAAAGWSRNSLLAEARLRVATAWLLHSNVPLAEVGLLSGHADQAHFTREFSRRMGVPPARLRQELRAGGGAA